MAGELAKKGHRVTIFEALHIAGGVLVYGIPEFRLPKAILEAEVEYLKKLGVEFRMSFVVGRTASLDDLREDGYEAFFIGTGAGLPNFMKIPGENLVGVYSANEYLTRVNLMRAYEFPEYDTPVFPGRRAAVIGGGNVAMDSVRTAKRLGAERAVIIYRRSRTEMPARIEEVKHAEEEGIEFHFLTTPIRYIGDEAGPAEGDGMPPHGARRAGRLGTPPSRPRRRLRVHHGSRPRRRGHRPEPQSAHPPDDRRPQGREMGEHRSRLETMATSLPGVYAGGDIVRGGATVILAMGDGRTAAAEIDAYLKRQ